MENKKELELKILRTRGYLDGAYSTYNNLVAVGGMLVEERKYSDEIDTLEGWLVGLGIAKGITECVLIIPHSNFLRNYINVLNPKSPYEQGIKEALEWCIGEGE